MYILYIYILDIDKEKNEWMLLIIFLMYVYWLVTSSIEIFQSRIQCLFYIYIVEFLFKSFVTLITFNMSRLAMKCHVFIKSNSEYKFSSEYAFLLIICKHEILNTLFFSLPQLVSGTSSLLIVRLLPTRLMASHSQLHPTKKYERNVDDNF